MSETNPTTPTQATAPAQVQIKQMAGMKILEAGSSEHKKLSKRNTKDREKEFNKMRKYADKHDGEFAGEKVEDYIANIKECNYQGKPVLVQKNGVNFLFQPQERPKNEQNSAVAQAQQEESIWKRNPWLAWVLGGLAAVGAAVGLYFLFRKKDKKQTAAATQTEPTTPTDPTQPTQPSKAPQVGIATPGHDLSAEKGGTGDTVITGNTLQGAIGGVAEKVDLQQGMQVEIGDRTYTIGNNMTRG